MSTIAPGILAPLLLALLSCSGGGSLQGGDPPPQGVNGPVQDSSSSSSDAGGSVDSETVRSTPPVQVSGAFLTSICSIADPSDNVPPFAGLDGYGCAIQQADGSKYMGSVQVNSLSVSLSHAGSVTPSLTQAPGTSRWHSYFYLPVADRGLVTGYTVNAVVDQTAVNLVYGPPRAAVAGATPAPKSPPAGPMSPAAVAPATPAPAPASGPVAFAPDPCTPVSVMELNKKPYAMDAANANSRGLQSSGSGAAPISILQGKGLAAGDSLSLSQSSGTSYVEVANDGTVSNGASRSQCPAGWRLYFLDKAGAILTASTADMAAFTNVLVPAGTVTTTIGYSEASGKSYADNEGNPALGAVSGSGVISAGCSFTFKIVKASCTK